MDEYIKRMVDEFLRWKLPADFAPDGGISHNFGHLTPTSPLWPVGTNLFTASQATDMFARCANSLIEDLARKDADCHSNGLRVETLESELARVREERDELRALLDGAQRDAARYKWLRDVWLLGDDYFDTPDPMTYANSAEEFDAAIDAERIPRAGETK